MDVVWIDEKQEYLRNGTAYHCYAPPETKSQFRTQRHKSGKAWKVKYEAAVCAWAGPIYLRFITGTTGLETPYKVRTSVPRWADPDNSTLLACLPSCIQHLKLPASVAVAYAHNIETLPRSLHADALVVFNLLLIAHVLLAISVHD
jgi:hypothetical protein